MITPTTSQGTTASNGQETWSPEVLPHAPRRHIGRAIATTVIAIAVAVCGYTIATNPRIGWDQVGLYLFNGTILSGVLATIELMLLCQAIGIALGTLLALCRVSHSPLLQSLTAIYSWLFRGTPVLVQLIIWFNLGLLFPHLGIKIPFTSIGWSVETNSLISGFVASLLALSLHEAAYMMEIVRGGIASVSVGQTEAALALGMTPRKARLRIVLPQTLRAIVPSTGNQFVHMLKSTSLVAFVAGGDLLTRVQGIYSANYQVIPLLIVASLWYLAMTAIVTSLQYVLERRVGQSYGRTTSGAGRGKLNKAASVGNRARPWRHSKPATTGTPSAMVSS
jgi:polar amino acid transport system permease protein